ncbi:helix-turn-helix domain-containing protein [Flavobacterium ustbae]|uniref:helix-turn-helix domain-containing protein n=1 Tax=Flavobacterium ustbae TaxID=2488790 RepID=UPI000F791F33|nr:helix-turn-helix transcriptional regulator [Flavobacterium ustbae]
MSTELKNIELYKKQFGERLKIIRESKGMTQLDLAVAINNLSTDSFVEKSTISRIENSRTNVTLSTIIKLSLALEIDIREFFNFSKSI